jgi:hypothetical protein
MARAMGYPLSPCGLIFCDRSTEVVSTLMSRTSRFAGDASGVSPGFAALAPMRVAEHREVE